MARRSKQLAVALGALGLERGDRVATLCWNHYQHLEAYFGIPCGGFVLHTINIRLHPEDVAYISNHGGDRVLIVDRSQLPLYEEIAKQTSFEHVFVVEDSYEELLSSADPEDWRDPELDEREAAAMCYTSGTTGRPKGVVYSHRSTILHALGVASLSPLGLSINESDTLLPVVPMFHVNAWGYPYLRADDRGEARLRGTARRCREPPRGLRRRTCHLVRRRADDLVANTAAPRCEPRAVGPFAHARHARRGGGGPSRDDRRLQGAARTQHRAGLGDDRDLARRLDHRDDRRSPRG